MNYLGIMLRLAFRNFCFCAMCCERDHVIANLVSRSLEVCCLNFSHKNFLFNELQYNNNNNNNSSNNNNNNNNNNQTTTSKKIL